MLKATRRDIQGMTALLLMLAVLALSACGNTQGAGKQASGGPAGTPKPISDLTFAGIRQQRKDAKKIEDWQEYRDTLIGQRIQWTGRVLYTSEPQKAGGAYEVAISMEAAGVQFSYEDVTFALPQEEATKLKKDQQITFQGDIKEINEMKGTVDLVLTVRLENVTIVP